jgi:F0F1-type ATP synthase assembly protein I
MKPRPRPDKENWQAGVQASSEFVGVGIQLAGSVLLYVGLGYLVDRWLDTSPVYLLVGACVGMVTFFIQLVRVVKRMNEQTARNMAGKTFEGDFSSWTDEADPDAPAESGLSRDD